MRREARQRHAELLWMLGGPSDFMDPRTSQPFSGSSGYSESSMSYSSSKASRTTWMPSCASRSAFRPAIGWVFPSLMASSICGVLRRLIVGNGARFS
eukprot:scaffold495_cov243-Pinguiococcus_pyrenoidosus.AAC.19